MTKTISLLSMPLGMFIGAILAFAALSIPSLFPTLNSRVGTLHLPFEIRLPTGVLETFQAQSASSIVNDAAKPNSSKPHVPFVCGLDQPYKTSVVSLDPLVIYLKDFISGAEIEALMATGDGLFKPSNVHKSGYNQVYTSRTSTSAFLPGDDMAVQCVLSRAKDFMGTFHSPGRDDMGAAQLVRYVEGQKFDVHHDWFDGKQISPSDPLKRRWNRIVSFFATLEDDCEEGETWFPHVQPVEPQPPLPEGVWESMPKEVRPAWRLHPDGGVAFRPIRGNAVFWVNLHTNGTGDMRTVHAGLPVSGGRKTAMNIWPKKYFLN